MIPERHITAWQPKAPWLTVEQIEQDLLLSRLIIEIANDPYLGDELVFRGGTCPHKLRLAPGLRYSEDLDYVRQTAGGIGPLTQALREVGERLGMKVNVEISKYPKVKFRAPRQQAARLRFQDGERTGNTGRLRSTTVTPGHSEIGDKLPKWL